MMTIDLLGNRWEALGIGGDANAHQRYDDSHPLQLFFGYDMSGERIFFIISAYAPERLPPQGETVDVSLLQRHDGSFTIAMRLCRSDQHSVFTHLCWDLAESTRACQDDASGVSTFLDRYRKWQRLFERGHGGLLSGAQVKGLVGELLFLEDHLFSRYGVAGSLRGWLGPAGSDQDFRFDDCWYEVKATDLGSSTIHISSLEQLDVDAEGQLCIVFLDRAGSNRTDAISLNSLVARIRDFIRNDVESADIFERRLEEVGYIDSREYSEDLFILRSLRRFSVVETFPRIRRRMLDPSVVRAGYDLNIGSLAIFEIAGQR